VTVRNALDTAFARGREDGRALLIPYVTAGYPQPDGFVELALNVLEAGADALELGIPFSDPLLDGPSIQRSQQQALEAGVTPAQCLTFARDIHARSDKPLLFMGAYNPVFAYGVDRCCDDAAEAGVAALIIPDVPLEEQGDLLRATRGSGLHLIQLVSPTSGLERLQRACAEGSGFIYCISVTGVTGARSGVSATARLLVQRVRACTEVPVAVGFGIAGPEQACEAASFADGVIVGSAPIHLLAEARKEERLERVSHFIVTLRASVVRASPELS